MILPHWKVICRPNWNYCFSFNGTWSILPFGSLPYDCAPINCVHNTFYKTDIAITLNSMLPIMTSLLLRVGPPVVRVRRHVLGGLPLHLPRNRSRHDHRRWHSLSPPYSPRSLTQRENCTLLLIRIFHSQEFGRCVANWYHFRSFTTELVTRGVNELTNVHRAPSITSRHTRSTHIRSESVRMVSCLVKMPGEFHTESALSNRSKSA